MAGVDLVSVIEEDIVKLANELNINEKYVRIILDGQYKAISLSKNNATRKVMIILKLPTTTGRQNNPVIKATKEGNQELVNKMDKFVQLVRVYRAFNKAEKVKEDYVVSLVS